MMKKLIVIGGFFFLAEVAITCQKRNKEKHKSIEKTSTDCSTEQYTDTLFNELSKEYYKEIPFPTPNIDTSRRNTVEGVILHHTAEPTVQRSLDILTNSPRRVGTCIYLLFSTFLTSF